MDDVMKKVLGQFSLIIGGSTIPIQYVFFIKLSVSLKNSKNQGLESFDHDFFLAEMRSI